VERRGGFQQVVTTSDAGYAGQYREEFLGREGLLSRRFELPIVLKHHLETISLPGAGSVLKSSYP
jgi:hypothetical protein